MANSNDGAMLKQDKGYLASDAIRETMPQWDKSL
ncbi:MAG: hypothetical protein GDYSWBUE_000612 [Candidatus Fervidibacterota bacterium]